MSGLVIVGVEFERWLPLPGVEDRYQISNAGSVRRNAPARGSYIGRVLKTRIRRTPSGIAYRYVDLKTANIKKTYLVHRLVAKAFHGDPPPGHEVRHMDGDSLNNCADNIEWGTKSQNMLDRQRHGTDRNAAKTHCNNEHEYTEANTYVVERMRNGVLHYERKCRKYSALNARKYRSQKCPV